MVAYRCILVFEQEAETLQFRSCGSDIEALMDLGAMIGGLKTPRFNGSCET
jgi:hypothetical protein